MVSTHTDQNAATSGVASTNTTLSDRVRGLRLPEQSTGDRGNRSWLPWALCALLAMSTVVLGFQAWAKQGEKAAKSAAPGEEAKSGEVAATRDVVLEAKGYIVPAHQIQVSPKVSGMVEELYIEEGKRFKQGDTLAVLEKTNYQYAVERARAQLGRAQAALDSARQRRDEIKTGNRPEEIEAAKATLAEIEAQRDQLYLEWKRNYGLKTGNALAIREHEQAEYGYKAMSQRAIKARQDYELMVKGARDERRAVAEAEVRQAESEAKQAEAELLIAQWNLDNCRVVAPVTGTILIKRAEKGNLVQPMAFTGSTSLCDMADLADLEAELSIQERDIAQVSAGQQCRIRPDAYQQRTYDGKVDRLMPIADRAKGAITVRVKVKVPQDEAEGSYLKPEMGVIVSFLKNSG
jgi:HlyD family secretion protein